MYDCFYDVHVKYHILPQTALNGLYLYWALRILCEVQTEFVCVI